MEIFVCLKLNKNCHWNRRNKFIDTMTIFHLQQLYVYINTLGIES